MTIQTTIDLQTLDDLMLSIDVAVSFDDDDDGGCYDGSYLMLEYSGRGMYGDRCIGVVCADPVGLAIELGIELGRSVQSGRVSEEIAEAFQRPQIDSMGRSQIIYWPRLAATSEEVTA